MVQESYYEEKIHEFVSAMDKVSDLVNKIKGEEASIEFVIYTPNISDDESEAAGLRNGEWEICPAILKIVSDDDDSYDFQLLSGMRNEALNETENPERRAALWKAMRAYICDDFDSSIELAGGAEVPRTQIYSDGIFRPYIFDDENKKSVENALIGVLNYTMFHFPDSPVIVIARPHHVDDVPEKVIIKCRRN